MGVGAHAILSEAGRQPNSRAAQRPPQVAECRIFRRGSQRVRRDKAAPRGARSRRSARRTKQYAKQDRKPSSIPNCRARDAARSIQIPDASPRRKPLPVMLGSPPPLHLSRHYLVHTTTSMEAVTRLLPGVWQRGDRGGIPRLADIEKQKAAGIAGGLPVAKFG